MAQEKMDSWWEYARELAKAERELKIEKWVYISIEYKEENGERVVLYHYDLPRELHERYRWVIRRRGTTPQPLSIPQEEYPYLLLLL